MPFRQGRQVAFGIFSESATTGAVIEELRRSGIPSREISVVMPARPRTADSGARGAAGGAVIGAGFGWLAGMGALGIPGIGPFIAAGPLLAALAGVGIGGTVGGIAGALAAAGVPDYEARRYEGFVKEGQILLAVHAANGSWAENARRILKAHGARDLSITSEAEVETTSPNNVHPFTRADDYQMHK
jgi:hypothetical protein